MNRVTGEERRRMLLPRATASRQMVARMAAPIVSTKPLVPRSWLRQVVKMAVIVGLLGGGWLASRQVQLQVPTSIVDALLPRF